MLHLESTILIDAIIVLLYDNNIKAKTVILDLLELFKHSKTILEHDRVYISLYTDIINEILSSNITSDNKNALYRLITSHQHHQLALSNPDAYNRLSAIILNDDNEVTEDTIKVSADRIYTKMLWYRVHFESMKLSSDLRRCGDCNDLALQKEYMQGVYQKANAIVKLFNDRYIETPIPGMVESIDLSNKESIKAALSNYNFTNVTHVVKTGWQGLNEMLGERGGFKLGESVCFAALSHHGKSFMLLSCALWMAKYNTPPNDTGGAKPAIVFVSLENEANENMMWIFKHLYMMEERKPCMDMEDADIVEYIYNKFDSYGYTLFIERYIAMEFGYDEFVSLVESKTASGYRIYGAMVDYTNNMKKTSSIVTNRGDRDDLLVRYLYRSMCQYTKANNILYITGHQLNRDAEYIAAGPRNNKVKLFNGGHFADAMDVQREVDLTIFVYIEKNHLGYPYFTFARGKHRYVENTPESHKYFAYKFTPLGILDDIHSEKGYTRDIYAETEAPMVDVPMAMVEDELAISTIDTDNQQNINMFNL